MSCNRSPSLRRSVCMCMCMCVCVCVRVCVCVCVCVCVYIYIYIYMHACDYMDMYVSLCWTFGSTWAAGARRRWADVCGYMCIFMECKTWAKNVCHTWVENAGRRWEDSMRACICSYMWTCAYAVVIYTSHLIAIEVQMLIVVEEACVSICVPYMHACVCVCVCIFPLCMQHVCKNACIYEPCSSHVACWCAFSGIYMPAAKNGVHLWALRETYKKIRPKLPIVSTRCLVAAWIRTCTTNIW